MGANQDPKFLRISIHREPIVIAAQDIIFIEVFNWKCLIHLVSGAQLEVSTPLKALAEQLVSPSFLRCGRSFLVNLEHLTGLSNDSLHLRGGTIIPVPRRGRAEILPLCSRFLAERCVEHAEINHE